MRPSFVLALRASLSRPAVELIPMSEKASVKIIRQEKPVTNDVPYTQRDQSDRVFPLRKQYLTHTYEAILANNNMMLAFLNANVKNAEISAVRRGLQALKGVNSEDEIPRLTVCNAGVFRGIVRKNPKLQEFWKLTKGGPLLIIHAKKLSPPLLPKILSVVDKSTGFKPSQAAPPPTPFSTAEALENPPPMLPVPMNPKLSLVGAVLDGTVMDYQAVRTLGTMPGLDTLRAQVLGVLGAPASQIAAVLGAASGGQLSRTLQGFEQSLKEKAEGGKPSEEA